jgi:hypothetical protein
MGDFMSDLLDLRSVLRSLQRSATIIAEQAPEPQLAERGSSYRAYFKNFLYRLDSSEAAAKLSEVENPAQLQMHSSTAETRLVRADWLGALRAVESAAHALPGNPTSRPFDVGGRARPAAGPQPGEDDDDDE